MAHSFVTVSGTQFVKNGSPLLFHGVGIGSWLNLEHFMVGIPTPDHQIRNSFSRAITLQCSSTAFMKSPMKIRL